MVRDDDIFGRGSVKFRELQRFLEKLGFIQPDGNEVKRYQIKQLRLMIEEFKLSDEG